MDGALLQRFGAASEHRPGEPLWEVMRTVGEDLVGFLVGTRQRASSSAFTHPSGFLCKTSEDERFKALLRAAWR